MKLSAPHLQQLVDAARQIGEQQVTVALPDGTTAEIHFRPRPQNPKPNQQLKTIIP